MSKYRQRLLLGVGFVACTGAVLVEVMRPHGWDGHAMVAIVLLVLGLLSMGFSAVRVLRFCGKLKGLLRLLLAGNYDAGVNVSDRRDEISGLERDLAKLSEQLREYDRLRAERVRNSQHLTDLVLAKVPQAIMLVDVEKGSVDLNPACLELLGISQHQLTTDAIEKIEANGPFTALLQKAVETEKSPQDARLPLYLPAARAAVDLRVRLHPLKDQNDAVLYVVILADTIGDSNGTSVSAE